jgi:hypothetical protein
MVKLEGKYRFVSQENFDAYLKASGWLIFISLISDYVVKSFSFATSRH